MARSKAKRDKGAEDRKHAATARADFTRLLGDQGLTLESTFCAKTANEVFKACQNACWEAVNAQRKKAVNVPGAYTAALFYVISEWRAISAK